MEQVGVGWGGPSAIWSGAAEGEVEVAGVDGVGAFGLQIDNDLGELQIRVGEEIGRRERCQEPLFELTGAS